MADIKILPITQKTVKFENITEGNFFEFVGVVYCKISSTHVLIISTGAFTSKYASDKILCWHGCNQNVLPLEVKGIVFERV